MQDDEEIRTVPSIPAPRRPEGLAADGDLDAPPGEVAGSGRRSRRPMWWAIAALLVVVLAVGIAVVATRGRAQPEAAKATKTAAVSASVAVPMPTAATPYANAVLALRSQTAAMGDANEAAWLSVVDPGEPALQERYRGIFRTLQAMGITQFEYDPGISKPDKKDHSAITFPTAVWYCFGPDTCRGDADPAVIHQVLTMKAVGGRWVITAVADKPDPKDAEPTPWQSGKLVFAVGKRVTVAAEPDEAGHLPEVLALAEKAAAAADTFAKPLVAEQTRYRVYLADEKQWKTWYGGDDDDWAIAVSMSISTYGTDVMLRMSTAGNSIGTQVTLQHEFGHVITLMGATSLPDRNRWLSEGVAEYIGWWPKPPTKSVRLSSVRWQLGRKRAVSMIPANPGPKASVRAGDAYYGLSHFAVACLAQKYSQDKMFRFVRLVLLRNETYDTAARDAFNLPFATVDKGCAAWIREQASGG